MDTSIRVMGPKFARDDFEKMAVEAGVDIRACTPRLQPGQIVNHVDWLQVVFSKESAAMFVALCGVITTWLAVRPKRQITVTTYRDGRIKSLDVRALTKDELLEILPKVKDLLLYDKKDDKST